MESVEDISRYSHNTCTDPSVSGLNLAYFVLTVYGSQLARNSRLIATLSPAHLSWYCNWHGLDCGINSC